MPENLIAQARERAATEGVMGRHTFEKVLSFDDWPYPTKPVGVLSGRPVDIPAPIADSVEWMSGEPGDIVVRLAARGCRHLYIDGGVTVQRFPDAGLIHKLIISRIPVLIGRGIPLFGPLRRDIPLRHIETRHYPDGIVQSDYEIA
jgi:dihydrofolate reductase